MKNKKIHVTKSYLPPINKYIHYLEKIWNNSQLTNDGPLSQNLESKLHQYLNCKNISIVNNGTIALQIAIEALDMKNEIITTPFSYIATSSSILWQKCKPIYADICPKTLNINPKNIEKLINKKTSGIIATHVFGNPCDVIEINKIAKKYKLKIIYDAAHAFGVKYKKNSILNYGDISILSFHATKLFHTIEGGALVTSNINTYNKINYMKNFGHKGEEVFQGVGINGKISEFHAAMGLCVLDNIDIIIKKRKEIYQYYNQYINNFNFLCKPLLKENIDYNYAYYPVIFNTEKKLNHVKTELNKNNIYPRRYFYPSLNNLHFINGAHCPISENICRNILCLPISNYLEFSDIDFIIKIIKKSCV